MTTSSFSNDSWVMISERLLKILDQPAGTVNVFFDSGSKKHPDQLVVWVRTGSNISIEKQPCTFEGFPVVYQRRRTPRYFNFERRNILC